MSGPLKVPCPDCGTPKKKTAERCSQCYRTSLRRTNRCGRCGGPVSTAKAAWCRPCRVQNSEGHYQCPICGGRKGWHSRLCYACDQAAKRTQSGDWHQIVQSFNPLAFRSEIGRSDLDWPIRQLAEVAGVNRTSIDNWLNGNAKPSRIELDKVMAVLCFTRCENCAGLGWTDPAKRAKPARKIAS